MNMKMVGKVLLYAGAFLLFGALALAQSAIVANPPQPKKNLRNVPSNRASGGHDQLGHAPGTAASHLAPQPPAFPGFKSMGSAHATESLAATPAPGKNEINQNQPAKPNPTNLSEEKSGENPLFQASNKDAQPHVPSLNVDSLEDAHETVEYKDPEDMTTRYRPGNNKTFKVVNRTKNTPPLPHE